MWSSVVPAVPWTVRVDVPQIAAASSSESIDLAVPGSPTSMRPCRPSRRDDGPVDQRVVAVELAGHPDGRVADDEVAHRARGQPPARRQLGALLPVPLGERDELVGVPLLRGRADLGLLYHWHFFSQSASNEPPAAMCR